MARNDEHALSKGAALLPPAREGSRCILRRLPVRYTQPMVALETLTYDLDDGVATVTLDRPEVLNAIDLRMRDELWALLDVVEHDSEARVLVFRGAGERAFSSGADLTDFGRAPSYVDARLGRLERDLWARVYALEKPTIAAVHGYALGAGCELALLCDLCIAADDALFGLPEVHLGYIPAAGGTQALPRAIGIGRALDMICSGEPVTAARALDYGIVQWVVPRQELDAATERIARGIAAAPAGAVRATKAAVNRGLELPLAEAIALESRLRLLLTAEKR